MAPDNLAIRRFWPADSIAGNPCNRRRCQRQGHGQGHGQGKGRSRRPL